MIHVCFAIYDKTGRYSKFTGTTMLSLFENTTSNVTVHILHDNTLPAENRDKFSYIAGRYGQQIKFYNVEVLCADNIKNLLQLVPSLKDSRYSVATFYRFLIPHVLPADVGKCIYLDSDLAVNLDINELWRTELGDKPLAAVPEIEIEFDYPYYSQKKYLIRENIVGYEDYFNAGVLYINLKVWRNKENTLIDGIKFLSEHPQCDYFDQDVLNYLFSKDYVKLPEKFDVFIGSERGKHYKSLKIRNAIYHCISDHLNLDLRDPINRLWMDYFIKTPFFDTDAVGRLYAGFQQIHVGLKNSMIQLSAALSGKTRAFFVPPNNRDAIKKFFSIRKDEEIILAENQDSLKKLLNAMKKSRGKKLFFIMSLNFPFASLTQAGFEHGKDFVNVFEFLSEAHGLPLNSFQLLKAM